MNKQEKIKRIKEELEKVEWELWKYQAIKILLDTELVLAEARD